MKNKQKIFEDFQARGGNHKNLDKAMFQWFLSVRGQDVPIGGAILKKGKVLRIYTRYTTFKRQMVGFVVGKSDTVSHSRRFLVKQILSLQKW